MKRLAVFCGSSMGVNGAYKTGAVQLGKELAKRNITLVYGGSSIGLMGVVADTVLEEGGEAIGVIPRLLVDHEVAHGRLTKLYTVETMHERKAKMADLADGFIVLPGGSGTLEEFFEMFTWAQIGIHTKPCGLLNIQHYYDPLIHLFDHMIQQGFLQEKFRTLAIVEENADALIDKFNEYRAPGLKTFN